MKNVELYGNKVDWELRSKGTSVPGRRLESGTNFAVAVRRGRVVRGPGSRRGKTGAVFEMPEEEGLSASGGRGIWGLMR